MSTEKGQKTETTCNPSDSVVTIHVNKDTICGDSGKPKVDNKTISYNNDDKLEVISIPDWILLDKKEEGYETIHREIYNFGELREENRVYCFNRGSFIDKIDVLGENMFSNSLSLVTENKEYDFKNEFRYNLEGLGETMIFSLENLYNSILEGQILMGVTGGGAFLKVDGKSVVMSINGTFANSAGEVVFEEFPNGVVLQSPNQSKYRVTVGDDGALTTTKIN